MTVTAAPRYEEDTTAAENFRELKSDHKQVSFDARLEAADQNNRFMRKRQGLGGTGDSQIPEWDLWFTREISRHMHMNDSLPAQATRRLVDSVIPSPYRLEPMTGDDALNQDLLGMWEEVSGTKDFDFYGERTFNELSWLAEYQNVQDGEVFGLLVDSGPFGQVQMLEAERCTSPTIEYSPIATENVMKHQDNTVAGVRFDRNGVAVSYFFTKRAGSSDMHYTVDRSDVKEWPIFDESGTRVVLQPRT